MKTALSEKQDSLLPELTQRELTPMAMVQLALQQNAGLDTISRLMDLQERWEKNEARKQFVEAMNLFKQSPPNIEKNRKASFDSKSGGGRVEYDYATLDNVTAHVTSALSAVGISHRWETGQSAGNIRVTCILTHHAGHSEQTTLECAPDASGAKNAIQAIGSAVSYLQRYTLLAATGLAVKGIDNDANYIPDGDVRENIEWIGNARDVDELKKLYTSAMKPAIEAGDKNAIKLYTEAKNKKLEDFGVTA